MKWTYRIGKKFKTALALAIVFVLVLTTNRINKSHFAELRVSFASVYEDRLLVENYIFKLSGLLNKRRLYLYDTADNNLIKTHLRMSYDNIKTLIYNYEQTKFTQKEAQLFNNFKHETDALQKLELDYYGGEFSIKLRDDIESKHQQLEALLTGLSDVQMKEGRNLINQSNNVIATNDAFSHIEIVILIIIGLVVQVLVLSAKPLHTKFPQNERLN